MNRLASHLSAIAIAAAIASPVAGPAYAKETIRGTIEQVGTNVGEMRVVMATEMPDFPTPVTERLRFEPYQMLDELFRDDIVFLMRHGPTDWSTRDADDVAPDDCANQRLMTEDGKDRMRQLGVLMVANDVVPGRIAVSRWCRNQETLEALIAGMEQADADVMAGVEVETIDDLNLLLSLQGAPNVTAMRRLIDDWKGEADGPLLVISHFTNIAELTEFAVYEGEILMVDPNRDRRVLGYLRLSSAAPDIGHFDPSVVPGASTAEAE